MFNIFYYLLALILYFLAIPYLLYKKRSKKYSQVIPAKFFLRNNPKFQTDKIWFHSCSMGETKALKPIFDKLNKNDINLSVITNTGYEQGSQMVDSVRYLPFEIFLPFWVTKQKVLLVMEAELWLMLFYSAFKNGTKTVLINARINDKSYKKYKKYSFFYKQLFKYVDKIFAQSLTDKKRLEDLGAKNIEVIGNIKLASLPKVSKVLTKPNATIITAGSTHKTEEELILNAWNKKQGKLLLVPRHPERFEEVFDLVKNKYQDSNVTFHKYSEQKNFESDIIVADVMGELINIYAISDVVILGGGFIKTAGGHNPIEPAFFNTVVISGETIFNQKSLFECVNNYYLVKNDELKIYLDDIKNLKQTSLGQEGTVEPILKYIKDI
ncbi:lipid IV(A) 3-deoxy-D-manno-octulosonic acid transferase [Arcobacter sp. 15-2]|uniref:lipid IV(A) 3-deoxy-D-manno-octulosonic acid transferase n=1 Tax=Arcobacter sp. 15-2 TaxID=3374109 RepID=UPI00399C90FA